MTLLQGSLLDLAPRPGFRPLQGRVRRTGLSEGAWFDHAPGWLAGSDALFDRLLGSVPWQQDRRVMYDSLVEVPRLTYTYDVGDPLPDPLLDVARELLSEHYRGELAEGFATAGMCLYRDGSDSVAWHGDRFGRAARQDTVVAILSLGAPRALALRPRGGTLTHRLEVGHGDLFVMGGSCQRTWEHAVPKTTRPVGPRISIQFRQLGVW